MTPVESTHAPLRERYGPLVAALQSAIDAGDGVAFRSAFDALREGLSAEFMPELKRLTASAESLVEANAKEAAELLEAWKVHGARSLAAASLWPERALGFMEKSLEDADRVRALLNEMLMAQGYQDITGQIIRSVIALVGEIEAVLGQLVALANGEDTRRMPALKPPTDDRSFPRGSFQQGMGPAVPGVATAGATVGGQDDIDALLASVAGGG
jgi:chemotaxis protein CheZ